MKKLLLSAGFFLLTLTAMSNAHATSHSPRANQTEIAAQVITIQSPEVKLMPRDNHNAEGFMDIINNGTQSHVLIAAYAPTDQETVLHTTVMKNGQPMMRRIKTILIPAKEATDLKFGGLHIMLKGIKQPLTAGTTVPITLLFDDGSALIVPAKVVG